MGYSMFGKNIVVKPVWEAYIGGGPQAALLSRGGALLVNSIWPTIQGEGPYAGEPAIFVRLSGCNLRCTFCDTEFEKGETMLLTDVILKIRRAMEICNTDLVVLTGGEPMRQQIIPFLSRCDDLGWLVQIETAGTVWPPDAKVSEEYEGSHFRRVSLESLILSGAVELVCSPKTPKVHEMIERLCQHYKYIIRAGEVGLDGLPNRSTQIEGKEARVYRPDPDNVIPTIWVQPCQEYHHLQQGAERPDAGRTHGNVEEVIRSAMKHGYRISLQTHRILGVD